MKTFQVGQHVLAETQRHAAIGIADVRTKGLTPERRGRTPAKSPVKAPKAYTPLG
jgi:hypothetical protein